MALFLTCMLIDISFEIEIILQTARFFVGSGEKVT